MKSNIKKLWIGILILAIACLATIACVIGVKASNVVDENVLNLEDNANTVVNIMEETVPYPVYNMKVIRFDGLYHKADYTWFDNISSILEIECFERQRVGYYDFAVSLPPDAHIDANTILHYTWVDGHSGAMHYNWRIDPYLVDAAPIFNIEHYQHLIYNGSIQKPGIPTIITPFGDITSVIRVDAESNGIDAREYYAVAILPDDNFRWLQTNKPAIEFVWRIYPKPIHEPHIPITQLRYNGSEQTIDLANYDPDIMSVTGNKGTNANTYTATISFKNQNYCWEDNTQNPIYLDWAIAPKLITKPTLVAGQSFTYNGNPQTLRFESYDTTAINITGNTQTNADTYYVIASLKSKTNYVWSGGSTSDIAFPWTINPKTLTKPSIKSNLTYTGSEQTIAFNNFDTTTMNVSGNKGTNANTYTATISLKSTNNYKWNDNTNTNFTLQWEIARKSIAQPTALADNVFIYTGSNFTYIPNGYNANQMDIAGNVQSEVDNYTASVTPNSNHMWNNGTTSAVTFAFEIIPAGITLRQNISLDYIYNDNGMRKSYGASYRHKLNDSELNIVNGETRYILGNIQAGTSIGEFLQSLQSDSSLIVIQDVNGYVLYDGLNNIVDLNKLVATGYEVILYKDNTGAEILDRVYLSVLGDLTGDGQINSADMALLNRILNKEVDVTNFSLELQLATMLNNNGVLTGVDREIMHNIIKDIDDTNNYFADKEVTSDYLIFELNGNKRVNKALTANSLVEGAVVGNITQGTKASEFVSKMQSQGINISISDMHRANNASLNENDIVGTGCYFTYNGNKIILTILGDVTGDGRVNAQDRLVIDRVASGGIKFSDMLTAVKLASLINNNGAVTSTDSEIIWQSIIGKVDINKYI